MPPDPGPEEPLCPVCATRMPESPGVRRCPRCGARALRWRAEPPCDPGVVLFNARIGGLTAGALIAMVALVLLGYRLPLPWEVVLAALACPIGGYILLGAGAQKVPPSWRTHYLVGVLAVNAGLLMASIGAVIGLVSLPALAGIVAGVAALTWPLIRRAVTEGGTAGDN